MQHNLKKEMNKKIFEWADGSIISEIKLKKIKQRTKKVLDCEVSAAVRQNKTLITRPVDIVDVGCRLVQKGRYISMN